MRKIIFRRNHNATTAQEKFSMYEWIYMTFIDCSNLFLLSVSKWLGSEVHYHLAEKGRKGENWRQRLFSGRAKNDTHFFSVTSCATKHRFHRLLDDKIIFLLSQITNTTNIFFFSAAFCLLGISFSRREKSAKWIFITTGLPAMGKMVTPISAMLMFRKIALLLRRPSPPELEKSLSSIEKQTQLIELFWRESEICVQCKIKYI